MKKLLIGVALVVTFATLSGCISQQIEKRFVLGKIKYEVHPKALESMQSAEAILTYVKGEETLPEEDLLTLYREADSNRDRKISPKEANTFYEYFTRRYEDSLGAINFSSRE